MAIRQIGIAAQRGFVRFHRLVLAVHVFEKNAEVVKQNGIGSVCFDRIAVDTLGFRETSGIVQKPSQIDMGVEERRLRGNSPLVRLYRGLDALMASDERSLRAWMQNRNTALNDVPAKRILTVQGLVDCVSYVDAYRARV